MTIHFICRGNAFRSVIAEAYLNSLDLDGVNVISSGTVADEHRVQNQPYLLNTLRLLEKHGIVSRISKRQQQLTPELIDENQIIICMNRTVGDEASHLFTLPKGTIYWDIADIGEPGRPVNESTDRRKLEDEVYEEITQKVNQLVRDNHLA